MKTQTQPGNRWPAGLLFNKDDDLVERLDPLVHERLIPLLLSVSCGQQASEQSPGPAKAAAPPPTQVTTNDANDRDAAWSPDGQWISFGSTRSGNEDIWKAPVGGGEATKSSAQLARRTA